MTAVEQAAELEREILAVMSRGVDSPLDEGDFNRLACRAFAHQYRYNAPYQAYCRRRGAMPETVGHWREIPAVPTDTFKVAALTTVSPEEVQVTYLTSGTRQGEGRRGRHMLPNTRLYDASLLPNARAHLFPEGPVPRVFILGPSAEVFPQSSLGHMNSMLLREFGAPGSGCYWGAEGPRFEALREALRAAVEDEAPVCLLGTAFGFVHLLDHLATVNESYRLPPGSRLMDTGGYKGRSREVPRGELYRAYTEVLGVEPRCVVNEYGMTELGSQFWDDGLRFGREVTVEQRRKIPPPWTRVVLSDPETLRPLGSGEGAGLIRFFDLANLHTVCAVQSDDLGEWRGPGFEVLGRATGAEPRGCSLTVEEFLESQGA